MAPRSRHAAATSLSLSLAAGHKAQGPPKGPRQKGPTLALRLGQHSRLAARSPLMDFPPTTPCTTLWQRDPFGWPVCGRNEWQHKLWARDRTGPSSGGGSVGHSRARWSPGRLAACLVTPLGASPAT